MNVLWSISVAAQLKWKPRLLVSSPALWFYSHKGSRAEVNVTCATLITANLQQSVLILSSSLVNLLWWSLSLWQISSCVFRRQRVLISWVNRAYRSFSISCPVTRSIERMRNKLKKKKKKRKRGKNSCGKASDSTQHSSGCSHETDKCAESRVPSSSSSSTVRVCVNVCQRLKSAPESPCFGTWDFVDQRQTRSKHWASRLKTNLRSLYSMADMPVCFRSG